MMSELFINYMREKGLEPTAQDLKDFNFMARVHLRDEVECTYSSEATGETEELIENLGTAKALIECCYKATRDTAIAYRLDCAYKYLKELEAMLKVRQSINRGE